MSIFKAYDIRGIYPTEIDERIAYRVAQGFLRELEVRAGPERGGSIPLRVVVGRDMRSSSPGLAAAAVEGLLAAGADVLEIGQVTTPAVYYAVATRQADGGLAVTASHNPGRFNGFKLCGKSATPFSYDDGIQGIEAFVKSGTRLAGARPGTRALLSVTDAYLAHLASFAGSAKPLKIAVDAGNGMGGPFVTRLLDRMGSVRTVGLYLEPDGNFPNHEANPLKHENLRDLQKAVRDEACDLGAAFDGDADRCAFVDARGAIVPTDLVTALLARKFLARHAGDAVVYDLRSSRVVPEEIRAAGGKPLRNRVGHSYMKKTMRQHGAVFGGELSGHYYFRDNFFCDSGLVTLASMLSLLWETGIPLADMVSPLARYAATGEVNFKVEDPGRTFKELAARFPDAKIDFLDGITVEYPDWWFNVRASNTEPALRLNLEAKDATLKQEKFLELAPLLGEPEK